METPGPEIPRRQLLPYLGIFVVVPIITYVVGRWLDGLLSLPAFPPFPANLVVGFAVFYAGLSIGIKSTKVLHREGLGLPWGEARKKVQSSRLVVTGPYAYTRNPMILGYSMLPCGMGFMFRSPGMFTVIPLVVVLINVGIVKIWEEPSLETRFGQEFLNYKESTPFLIPGPRNLVNLVMESYLGKPDRGDDSTNN
jgi:protein-S-isoprenylcysteine O-methyltransferase Ste14